MKKSKKANRRQRTSRYYDIESCPVNSRQEFVQRCWFIFGCFFGDAREFSPRVKDKELLKLFIREAKKGRIREKSGPKASYLTKIEKLKEEGKTLREAVRLSFSDIVKDQPLRLNYDGFNAMPANEQRKLIGNIKRSLRRRLSSDYITINDPHVTELGCLARDYFAYLCSAALSGDFMSANSDMNASYIEILKEFASIISSGLRQEMFKKKRVPIAKLDQATSKVRVIDP